MRPGGESSHGVGNLAGPGIVRAMGEIRVRSRARLGIVLGAAGWLLAACGPQDAGTAAPEQAAQTPATEEPAPKQFVGITRCAGCHADQAASFERSHHDLAMQVATPETALAPFEGEVFTDGAVETRFSQRDGGLVVFAEAEDGQVRAFEVPYLFGVAPLQQLLLDRGQGRLGALHLAWDARTQKAGGQRWFSLHGDERIPPGDPLHWTGPGGDWNVQCAACHSTGLETGYDPDTRSYDPAWAEPDVGCEACHGPGSRHVAWAEAGGVEAEPAAHLVARPVPRDWSWKGDDPIARRVPQAQAAVGELDVCAPCHARRAAIGRTAPGAPFLDGYEPALLEPGLYHADGQILDEVYVYGSFVQSRMHAAGVVCSDCHDPHRLQIESPDAVCAGCHRAEVFAQTSHHRHPEASEGASCVGCHMPARTYMQIDPRRDHGFRVPRPDLSVRLGVPNACTGCHTGREDAWAAEQAKAWWGEPGDHSTLRPDPVARLAMDGLAPWLRGSAAAALAGRTDPAALAALQSSATRGQALERLGASRAAAFLPAPARWQLAGPLLHDATRAVRLQAARALTGLADQAPSDSDARALSGALDELRAGLLRHLDRPDASTQLGDLDRREGREGAAEAHYRRALAVGPWFVPASINLVDLLRSQERDAEGEAILERALAAVGAARAESVPLHQSLGLLRVRQGRHAEALAPLAEATRLAPDDPRSALLYGLTLEAVGRVEEARPFLERGGSH